MFSHIVGNDHIKEYLTRMVRQDTIGNSLLFAGPDGIGKSLFAEAFAKMVLAAKNPSKFNSGNHPDLHIYRPEGKIGMHSIQSMRQLKDEVYLPPYESERKVFIIHDAERMLAYSSNALLKTFEEPPLDTIIILLSSSPELLLPTIRSRCRPIFFKRLTETEVAQVLKTKGQISEEDANKAASLSGGSAGKAFKLHADGENPIRQILLNMLAGDKFTNYSQLSDKANEIAEITNQAIQQLEESAKADLIKGFTEKLSAAQTATIEKEVDGIAAMQLAREASFIFETILAWYRDLHLLVLNGSPEYLFHRDRSEVLQHISRKGQTMSIEEVLKIIKSAKLSLERSTSLNLILENIFLKLNLI